MHSCSAIFLLLFTVQLITADSSQETVSCTNGICVAKSLCPEGGFESVASSSSVSVSVYSATDDECAKYEKVCCRQKNSTEGNFRLKEEDVRHRPVPCGMANEGGLLPAAHRNKSFSQFGEYPWVVAILSVIRLGNKGEIMDYHCAGSLIHARIVLTAAHCVEQFFDDMSSMIVRLGEWDFAATNELLQHQDIHVASINLHPEYDAANVRNDVALIALQESASIWPHIRTICLPQAVDSFDNSRCIVNGWGKMKYSYANVMKKVELPIVPRNKCKELLRIRLRNPLFKLDRGFICAGGETGDDACDGDGGGPLACRAGNGKFVQVGIAAWGLECGEKNVPGAYVSVSVYVDWIQRTISQITAEGTSGL